MGTQLMGKMKEKRCDVFIATLWSCEPVAVYRNLSILNEKKKKKSQRGT